LRHPRTVTHYEESLQSIVDEAERLTSLSNQLLMLAREDAGLNEAIDGTTDIGELMREAVADIEPLAEQKNLRVQLNFKESVSIPGDPCRLRRVLINLLDNAIKYTPAGGRVDVTITRKSDMVELTVADTGIGISAEHLEHVFERFYRADASHCRVTGGTGLGLAICKSIIASHHGRVAIQSRPDVGTQVQISLPTKA